MTKKSKNTDRGVSSDSFTDTGQGYPSENLQMSRKFNQIYQFSQNSRSKFDKNKEIKNDKKSSVQFIGVSSVSTMSRYHDDNRYYRNETVKNRRVKK